MLQIQWHIYVPIQAGRTCLHLAAAYGHDSIVEYLIDMGLDVNIATKVGTECSE